MKKIWCMLLLTALLLTACGNQNAQQNEAEVQQVRMEEPDESDEQTTQEPLVEVAADAEKESIDSSDEASATKDNGYVYYIKVNYQANTVTVYSKDIQGNYTIPCRAMVCSTGTYTPTSGVYRLDDQERWHWLSLQDDVYGQYCTQITGNILFHSVPYTSEDMSTLEYWEFDKLGTSCSAGCVRLQVRDAVWIYENKANIYAVEFYASSDPGPLGKPTAPKISSNTTCRGWDPTDPNSKNPWHKQINTAGSYVGATVMESAEES